MKTIGMKKAKLLSAFAVLAIAFAVFAAIPAVAEDSDATGTVTSENDAAKEFRADIADGAYTVTGSQEITLVTVTNGNALAISKDTVISGTGTLTINFKATESGQSVISVADGKTLTISGGVTIIIKLTGEGSITGCHVIGDAAGPCGGNVKVIESTVKMSQSVQGTSIAIDEGTFTLTNSTLNLDGAHGIHNTQFDSTGSDIILLLNDDSSAGSASIKGSFESTTITSVTNKNTSTPFAMNIWFYGGTKITNSEITSPGVVGFYQMGDKTIDATGSTITATKVKENATGAENDNSVTVIGGTFKTGKLEMNSGSKVEYKGSTLMPISTEKDSAVEIGAGIKFTGTVNCAGEIVSLDAITAGTSGLKFTVGSIGITGAIETDVDGNITVYGDAVVTSDFTIPAGTTVTIIDGGKLTINQSVTLTVSGTNGLVNKGDLVATGNIAAGNDVSNAVVLAEGSTTTLDGTFAGVVKTSNSVDVKIKEDSQSSVGVIKPGIDGYSATNFNDITTIVETYPDVEKITFTGNIVISGNFTLPEGITLVAGATTRTTNSITVESGVKFTNEGTIAGSIIVKGIFENNGVFGTAEANVSEVTVSASDAEDRCYVINSGTMYLNKLIVNNSENKRITEFTNAGELYLTSSTSNSYYVHSDAVFENTGSIYGEGATIEGTGSFVNTNGDVGCKVSTATITGTMSVEEISGKTSGSRTYGALQELVIPEGKTWTISKANEITINGKLTVYGTLVVEGKLIIAGAGSKSNAALLDADGTVTISKDATMVIGIADATQQCKANAVIDGTMNVDGTLEVVYTDTIDKYGNLVDGFAVNGSMTVSKTGAIVSKGITVSDVKYEGYITVNGDMTVNGSFDDAEIRNKGTITIDNAKTEAAGNGEVCIKMHANGAVLNINSFKFITIAPGKWNYISIADEFAVLKDGKQGSDVIQIDNTNMNEIMLDAKTLGVSNAEEVSASFVGNLVITESITSKVVTEDGKKYTQYTNKMDVSGSASASVSYTKVDSGVDSKVTAAYIMMDGGVADKTITSATETFAYKVTGGINVDGELTIGKYVDLRNIGVLDVSGTLTYLDKNATAISNDAGEITVTGLITTLEGIATGGVVNAAYYEITTGTGDNESTTKNYSAFASAVGAVTVEGNTADKDVTIMGNITIEENVTVPAGVSVIFDKTSDENTLTVGTTTEEGRAVTVTFAKTATMRSASEQVIVNGTLTFEDKTNDLTRDTVSDVTVEDEAENGERTYTNIFTAIQNSSAGQTITVTKETGNVKITQSLIIPEGVTLYVPADAVSIVLDDGVTLTIDGTLMTELDVLAETMFGTSAMDLDKVVGGADEKRSSAIVVNGYMLVSLDVATNGLKYSDSTVVAGNGYSSLIAGAPIYGAYYTYDTDWAAVSPVDKAISVIDKITDAIVLNGPITLGDIAFTGTDDCDRMIVSGVSVKNAPANSTVAINTVVTANSITMADATFNVTGTFNGSVVVGGATVTFTNVTSFSVGFNSDDKPIVEGNLNKGTGEVSPVVTLAAGSLLAPSTLNTTTSFTVASGATLVADGATFKTLKVAGTVSVGSNKVLNVNDSGAVLSVLEGGVLDVAAATDTTAQGTVNVTTLDVGMDSKKETTGAVATVNGPVNVTSKAFVVAGSTVSADTQAVLDKMYSTQYNVNGALWMTVYAQSSEVGINEVTKAPVENAWFGGWENAKGVEASSGKYVGSKDWKVVDAIIKTDVYKVFVYANEGIANVYIDGNLMQKGTIVSDNAGELTQGYYLMVAAGEHKITYDLTNGWTGTAAFKVNGDTISGNAFTTSGTPKDSGVSFDPIVYNVQISGLEKSGYVPDSPDAPAESGMGITDYLLIILVVLIVVMAIIVAMRLMRS